MTISVTCSNGHTINASEKYAGKVVKCPKCNVSVQIPEVMQIASSEEEFVDLSATIDPFSDFPSDTGSSDPFSQSPAESPMNYASASYAPTSYAPTNYSPTSPAGAVGTSYPSAASSSAASGPSSSAGAKGKKPVTESSAQGMPAILIGLIFGGGTFVLVLGVLGSVLFLLRDSIPRFGTTNQLTATSFWGSDSANEIELAKAEFILQNFPDGKVPEGRDQEIIDDVVQSWQKFSSASAPVYLGYDSVMCARMRKYLVSQEISEGKAALVAFSLAGTVRMLAQELDLPVDSNGNYPFPKDFGDFRKLVLDKKVDESQLKREFKSLQPLFKAHEEGKLSEENLDLLFYAKLAVIRV